MTKSILRRSFFLAALLIPLIAGLNAYANHHGDAPKTLVKPTFEEGKHYTVLAGTKKPAPGKKVEVTEMFWYGCSHCYKFETEIHRWEKTKADYITFVGSPAMWKQRAPGLPSDMMWTHAKLYYAAKALGVLDKLHPVFFNAMHKENKRLVDPKEIQQLVAVQGVDGKNFLALMESFAVKAQVDQADKRQRRYKVSGTPELVVGGHYHISGRKAGSQRAMLQVASYLAEKIYKGE